MDVVNREPGRSGIAPIAVSDVKKEPGVTEELVYLSEEEDELFSYLTKSRIQPKPQPPSNDESVAFVPKRNETVADKIAKSISENETLVTLPKLVNQKNVIVDKTTQSNSDNAIDTGKTSEKIESPTDKTLHSEEILELKGSQTNDISIRKDQDEVKTDEAELFAEKCEHIDREALPEQVVENVNVKCTAEFGVGDTNEAHEVANKEHSSDIPFIDLSEFNDTYDVVSENDGASNELEVEAAPKMQTNGVKTTMKVKPDLFYEKSRKVASKYMERHGIPKFNQGSNKSNSSRYYLLNETDWLYLQNKLNNGNTDAEPDATVGIKDQPNSSTSTIDFQPDEDSLHDNINKESEATNIEVINVSVVNGKMVQSTKHKLAPRTCGSSDECKQMNSVEGDSSFSSTNSGSLKQYQRAESFPGMNLTGAAGRFVRKEGKLVYERLERYGDNSANNMVNDQCNTDVNQIEESEYEFIEGDIDDAADAFDLTDCQLYAYPITSQESAMGSCSEDVDLENQKEAVKPIMFQVNKAGQLVNVDECAEDVNVTSENIDIPASVTAANGTRSTECGEHVKMNTSNNIQTPSTSKVSKEAYAESYGGENTEISDIPGEVDDNDDLSEYLTDKAGHQSDNSMAQPSIAANDSLDYLTATKIEKHSVEIQASFGEESDESDSEIDNGIPVINITDPRVMRACKVKGDFVHRILAKDLSKAKIKNVANMVKPTVNSVPKTEPLTPSEPSEKKIKLLESRKKVTWQKPSPGNIGSKSEGSNKELTKVKRKTVKQSDSTKTKTGDENDIDEKTKVSKSKKRKEIQSNEVNLTKKAKTGVQMAKNAVATKSAKKEKVAGITGSDNRKVEPKPRSPKTQKSKGLSENSDDEKHAVGAKQIKKQSVNKRNGKNGAPNSGSSRTLRSAKGQDKAKKQSFAISANTDTDMLENVKNKEIDMDKGADTEKVKSSVKRALKPCGDDSDKIPLKRRRTLQGKVETTTPSVDSKLTRKLRYLLIEATGMKGSDSSATGNKGENKREVRKRKIIKSDEGAKRIVKELDSHGNIKVESDKGVPIEAVERTERCSEEILDKVEDKGSGRVKTKGKQTKASKGNTGHKNEVKTERGVEQQSIEQQSNGIMAKSSKGKTELENTVKIEGVADKTTKGRPEQSKSSTSQTELHNKDKTESGIEQKSIGKESKCSKGKTELENKVKIKEVARPKTSKSSTTQTELQPRVKTTTVTDKQIRGRGKQGKGSKSKAEHEDGVEKAGSTITKEATEGNVKQAKELQTKAGRKHTVKTKLVAEEATQQVKKMNAEVVDFVNIDSEESDDNTEEGETMIESSSTGKMSNVRKKRKAKQSESGTNTEEGETMIESSSTGKMSNVRKKGKSKQSESGKEGMTDSKQNKAKSVKKVSSSSKGDSKQPESDKLSMKPKRVQKRRTKHYPRGQMRRIIKEVDTSWKELLTENSFEMKDLEKQPVKHVNIRKVIKQILKTSRKKSLKKSEQGGKSYTKSEPETTASETMTSESEIVLSDVDSPTKFFNMRRSTARARGDVKISKVSKKLTEQILSDLKQRNDGGLYKLKHGRVEVKTRTKIETSSSPPQTKSSHCVEVHDSPVKSSQADEASTGISAPIPATVTDSCATQTTDQYPSTAQHTLPGKLSQYKSKYSRFQLRSKQKLMFDKSSNSLTLSGTPVETGVGKTRQTRISIETSTAGTQSLPLSSKGSFNSEYPLSRTVDKLKALLNKVASV